MRSRREWAREYSAEIIKHAERWCERYSYKLVREFTYPKLPCDGYTSDAERWRAWHVDALMNAAHAIMVATDISAETHLRAREWQYACRCFWQACEYLGKHGAADSSWFDEHQRMRGIMDDAARAVPEALK